MTFQKTEREDCDTRGRILQKLWLIEDRQLHGGRGGGMHQRSTIARDLCSEPEHQRAACKRLHSSLAIRATILKPPLPSALTIAASPSASSPFDLAIAW